MGIAKNKNKIKQKKNGNLVLGPETDTPNPWALFPQTLPSLPAQAA